MKLPSILATLAVSATVAHGATLGIYSNPECTSCGVGIGPGESRFLFVCLDADAAGVGPPISSGAFRINGLPAGWGVSTQVQSSVHTFNGSPFESGFSFNLAAPSNGVVPLVIAQITSTTAVRNTVMSVEAPVGGQYICPTLQCSSCEIPDCVAGRTFVINGTASCSVAVTAETWSRVRRLYR